MAHYALLDENNFVIQVITGVDETIIQIDSDGTPIGGSTENWEHFYASRPWLNAASCKRTSYNGNFRKNYASVGYYYDQNLDAFIAPKPFNSWTLDQNDCQWKAPISKPDEDKTYIWDEETVNWIEA